VSPHLTADDIAAIRSEEGGLADLIAAITNRPTANRTPAPPAIGSNHAPGHQPGAWPAGTRTDRPTCHADCTCALNQHTRPAAMPSATPAA
jgi:hypothetical protein